MTRTIPNTLNVDTMPPPPFKSKVLSFGRLINGGVVDKPLPLRGASLAPTNNMTRCRLVGNPPSGPKRFFYSLLYDFSGSGPDAGAPPRNAGSICPLNGKYLPDGPRPPRSRPGDPALGCAQPLHLQPVTDLSFFAPIWHRACFGMVGLWTAKGESPAAPRPIRN